MYYRWQQFKYSLMSVLRGFMVGRNGIDQLSRLLLVVGLVTVMLSTFTHSTPLFIVGYVLLFYSLFRSYSRNIPARRQENDRFMAATGKVAGRVRMYRQMFAERGSYKYLKCPACGRRMKVPRGRGKINIHCPGCGDSFIKKV